MGSIGEFFNGLGDGWTIWLWLVAGGLIIIAAIIGIMWAAKNGQFDEDIKYLVFTEESDRERMSDEEYKKSREVIAEQEAARERVLKEQAEAHAKHS